MLCPQNELLFWQRFAVKPPLGVLNAMLAQPVALAFGFHPFGDGGQIERFGHFNNVRRQRPEVHISINLSVDDLRSPTLPTLLHDQLQHWGIAAEQIILEITERGFVDPETTMPVIAHYRQAGHRISIDDFGTGYSSLSYLQKLDVDTLKIDKSFVDTLEYRPLPQLGTEIGKNFPDDIFRQLRNQPGLLGQRNKNIRR